jgi:RNA polymerase sigma-70 factor, ECF subfamily
MTPRLPDGPSEAAARRPESDRQRFARIVRPHLALLLRTAGYLTGDAHAAEDLAQETAMRALRFIDGFTEGTDARAWLLTILRRTHVDLHRRGRRHARMLSLEAEGAAAAAIEPEEADVGVHDADWSRPAELMERFGDAEVIAALKRLPEAVRWTLLLVDVEQMDHRDAAAVLEVAEGTVKSRAHRGRAMLRDLLFELARRRGWIDKPSGAVS